MSLAETFLALPSARRARAFEQAALGQAGQAAILEKDFWVSWLLGVLFSLPEVAPHLVFKGGTSLFKVFGVIDRFSEDIDLCLVPEFVGADAAGFDALTSRGKRDAAVMQMQALCSAKAQAVLMPALEAAIASALGSSTTGGWLRFEVDADAKSPIVYFAYPSTQGGGFDYLSREVKLELGTLTDQQPTGSYAIQPLLADAFPQLFDGWSCSVTALELKRTFWEKATILHAEFHRPTESPTPTPMPRSTWPTRPSASAWWTGKAECFPVAGRATTWRATARFDSYLLRSGRPIWHMTMQRCGPCS